MQIPSFPQEEIFISLARRFRRHGYQLYLVGGAVRSLIKKQIPQDWDCATDATPEELLRLYPKSLPTGIQYGTITIFYLHLKIEVTSFRAEQDYHNARHPHKLHFGVSLSQDLARRDFSINALAWDPLENTLVDEHQGLDDLAHQKIRCIGEAHERFAEDRLRVLRAIRFCAQLGFTIEEKTWQALVHERNKLESLSIERIQKELEKTFLAPFWTHGLQLLEDISFWTRMGLGPWPIRWNKEELSFLENLPSHLSLRLLGFSLFFPEKPFLSFLERTRFPKKIIKLCLKLHPLLWKKGTCPLKTERQIRHFLASIGRENKNLIEELYLADPSWQSIQTLSEQESQQALCIKELAINGEHLKEWDIAPQLRGTLLEKSLLYVLDEPANNTLEELKAFILRERTNT